MKSLVKIFELLTSRLKLYFIIVTFSIIITSIIEASSVASIMPFVNLLNNSPAQIDNILINFLKNILNQSGTDLIYKTGYLVITLLVLTSIVKSFSTYLQINFARKVEYSLSQKLISSYLSQNYEWFLNKNSSNLGKNLLQEVAYCCNGIVLTSMRIIAQINLTIFIVLMLFIVNPEVAFKVFLFLSILVLTLIFVFKNFIKKNSNQRLQSDLDRYKAVGEVFGAVKDVKVASLENEYIKRFTIPAKQFAASRSFQKLLVVCPKYILEGLIFSGIIFYLILNISGDKDFEKNLPLLSLYLVSIYKLMPAFLDIYSSISNFSYFRPSLNIVYSDIKNSNKKLSVIENSEKLSLSKFIELRNIYYKYPESNDFSLENINLKIKVGSTNGFAGFTGSGKTTLIDIILGLLFPNNGQILLDNKVLNKNNIRSWQKNLGYVSQNIYLSDDSIAANIALGYKASEINWDKIYRASKIACLNEFVMGLEEKYHSLVGERGVKLSGGQIQRIGLARALYNLPEVLILDEATSALDNITERRVMNNIFKECKAITLIIIAHRITTIEKCDNIFVLNDGKIEASGTYSNLAKENSLFRNLVGNN